MPGPHDPSGLTHGSWWGPQFVPLLLFTILIGVVIWGILRLTAHRAAAPAAAAPAGAAVDGARRDPALEELRVRYARGEVDRTEYLARSVDLGGGSPGPTQE